MANHGYCKNCWWYQQTQTPGYQFDHGKIYAVVGEGVCYMQSSNIGIKDAEVLHKAKDNDYCQDYTNRTKTNKTCGSLEDWIISQYKYK